MVRSLVAPPSLAARRFAARDGEASGRQGRRRYKRAYHYSFKFSQAQPLDDRILIPQINRHAAIARSMRRKPIAALVFLIARVPLHPEERHLMILAEFKDAFPQVGVGHVLVAAQLPAALAPALGVRSEEHTSELQSRRDL